MSARNRYQSTRVVTYSRKSSSRGVSKTPVSQDQTTETSNEKSSSFWDFGASSDEDEPVKIQETSSNVSGSPLKRKAGPDVDRVGKKMLPTRRSATPGEGKQRTERSEENKRPAPERVTTPRKSHLIARNTGKEVSPELRRSSRRTSVPPATPPRPVTPKSTKPKLPSTPPLPSPQTAATTPKRTLARVYSSPFSSPPASGNSISQPLPTTPIPHQSRTISRSNTFHDFSSPKMTPKQETTWSFLPIAENASPSRRRLVDKLREQIKTPDFPKTQPREIQPPLDDQISRILEYTVPIVEEPRRKEPSQSESQGTYLSRSRSFLAESQDISQMNEIWQPDPTELDEEEDVGVKSWHELKRGGQDKRFLDEMEDLLEQSKHGGRLGLRRSSVLQIVEKLYNDGSWRRKLKALGLLSTFLRNVVDAYSDPILLLLTLLAVDLVPKPVSPTIATEVLELCLAGLMDKRDLISLSSLRSLAVSKILKSELLALQTHVSKSQILPNILTSRNLSQNVLIDLCVADIRPICAILPDIEDYDQWRVLSAIATSLEKSTQAKLVTNLEDQHVNPFNPILQQGISEFETDTLTRKATLSFLRVCINLTNSSTAICESLNKDLSLVTLLTNVITSDSQRYCDAEYPHDTGSVDDTSSIQEEEHEKKESRFELLLLSLGLMINFVQESDMVKDMVLSSSIATNIKDIFERLIEKEESANHALGYLALLLAHLIIPAKSTTGVSVEGGTRRWVERLLDDFVGIHRVVQSQSQEAGERKEVEGMAGEVEKVLIKLREQ